MAARIAHWFFGLFIDAIKVTAEIGAVALLIPIVFLLGLGTLVAVALVGPAVVSAVSYLVPILLVVGVAYLLW